MQNLSFKLGDETIEFSFDKVFVIGYSGRDLEKLKCILMS